MQNRQGIFSGSTLAMQNQYRYGIQRIPLAMEKAEIPIGAAVAGPAIGAGFDLAAMCDLRIASTNAVICGK